LGVLVAKLGQSARFGGARSLAPSDARTRRAFGAASGNAAEWRTPTPPATSDAPFVPDEGFLSDLELLGAAFAAPRLAPGKLSRSRQPSSLGAATAG